MALVMAARGRRDLIHRAAWKYSQLAVAAKGGARSVALSPFQQAERMSSYRRTLAGAMRAAYYGILLGAGCAGGALGVGESCPRRYPFDSEAADW